MAPASPPAKRPRPRRGHRGGHPAGGGEVVALDPARMKRLMEDSKAALDEIVREYEWLHNSIYGQRSGAGGSTRSDSRFSRQTENTALGAVERSGRVRQVSQLMESLNESVTGLARSLRARPETSERPDQFPPTISPDELQSLREAKVRRESRGEGWGSS